jgi:hypothetical protein
MLRSIRIAVIDRYPIFRVGIERTIARRAEVASVGQGENAAHAFSAVQIAARSGSVSMSAQACC